MHEKPLNTPSPPPTPPPLLLPSFPGKPNPSLMMDPPPPPPLPADAAGKPKKPPPPPQAAALRPPDQQSLRCPRCDSPNTKFCYYNNYSLTQPRHFCKTCRRYWTKGGALRNVPIGGGCRKAKKSKSSSSSSATATSPASTINSSSSSARLPIDSLKFFSPPASAFDFQLGMLPFHSAAAAASHLVPFADYASSPNYHVSDLGVVSGDGHHSAIAASIESLSNINQDLHWKLQQQRLAMLFGGGCGEGVKDSLPAAGGLGDCQAMESISFQVADGPKGEAACGARADHAATTTAWFLDNPYTTSLPNSNPRTTTTANAAGIKAWNEMHHFTALP